MVDTGEKVAIENQLEWTDHTHLTQLLTYAAGLDARIAVWVAPEFRYEHAEALHWLNEWTPDGLQFYGVKIMLRKTDAATAEGASPAGGDPTLLEQGHHATTGDYSIPA